MRWVPYRGIRRHGVFTLSQRSSVRTLFRVVKISFVSSILSLSLKKGCVSQEYHPVSQIDRALVSQYTLARGSGAKYDRFRRVGKRHCILGSGGEPQCRDRARRRPKFRGIHLFRTFTNCLAVACWLSRGTRCASTVYNA